MFASINRPGWRGGRMNIGESMRSSDGMLSCFVIAHIAFAASFSTTAMARANAIDRQKVSVDGQSFRVIRYDNGSVKVVNGGIFGDATSYNLRERMRRAAKLGTGCDITDDFWLDGKLIGTLRCPNEGAVS